MPGWYGVPKISEPFILMPAGRAPASKGIIGLYVAVQLSEPSAHARNGTTE